MKKKIKKVEGSTTPTEVKKNFLDNFPLEEKRATTTWVLTLIIFFLILHGANYDFSKTSGVWVILLLFDILIGGIAFLYLMVNVGSRLFKKETFRNSAISVGIIGILLFSFFTLLIKLPTLVSTTANNHADDKSSISSSSQYAPRSPLPTLNTSTVAPKATSKTSAAGSITCVGPDDKQFATTLEECKALNEKWGKPVDFIVTCNIHTSCGGGTKSMRKSECDKPCSGLPNTNTATSNTNTNTKPSTGSNYFCINNVTGYTYYTTSGDQCNKDNYRATCLDLAKKVYYDPCMDTCYTQAINTGHYCIYDLAGAEKDACLEQQSKDHQTCMDACAVKHETEYKKCY